MLATVRLEKSFWAEAINTVCYMIDRSPSTAVELKTPMEIWTKKPVNYSDLYIFGSHVYVMKNTQETTKLDLKYRKCLFLGYAEGVKGYRLWDPTAHKVVISRDVSQALATRTLNRERKRPRWHSDYAIEINFTYCLLIEEGEPSTLQGALNNLDASLRKEAMQEEIEALHKNKTWELGRLLPLYIKGTSDVALCFGDSDLIVKGYVDSNYTGDLDESKSTTGYVFTLSGETASWVLKLQSVVAMSTTEAKYVVAAQTSKEAVWLKMLLEELEHKQEKITLFCDNQSALYLARNPTLHSKIKHIRV
ncbi:gag-pol polyprotein [Tanacetum coccineum]